MSEPSQPQTRSALPAKPRFSPTRYLEGWKKRRDSGSKMILAEIKAAGTVRASIKAFKQKVARGFGQHLEPELRDRENLPDHALTLDLIGRSVETVLDQLLDVDRQYARAVASYNYLTRQSQDVAKNKLKWGLN